MIFDCFIFHSELELLEIRVNELAKCKEPVTHILIESKYTFTGKKKPLFFDAEKEKFKDFPIVSISIDNLIEGGPWDREKFQRNLISNALKLFNPSDENIVIISDADEIPSYSAIDNFCTDEHYNKYGFACLMMNKYGYWLNCLEGVESWNRARIMKYEYLKDKSPEEVRNSGYPVTVPYAGWHWSWLGGVDKVKEKFDAFSHQELNIDQFANPQKLEQKIKTGQSLWTDDENDKWEFVHIDESYPEYVFNNIDKFKHLIHGI